jgi:hypothetical protein
MVVAFLMLLTGRVKCRELPNGLFHVTHIVVYEYGHSAQKASPVVNLSQFPPYLTLHWSNWNERNLNHASDGDWNGESDLENRKLSETYENTHPPRQMLSQKNPCSGHSKA